MKSSPQTADNDDKGLKLSYFVAVIATATHDTETVGSKRSLNQGHLIKHLEENWTPTYVPTSNLQNLHGEKRYSKIRAVYRSFQRG